MSFNNPIAEEAAAESRSEPRTATSIRGLVLVKESLSDSWKEHTNITSVSKNGAGYTLSRPCVVGRLVSIVSPMPNALRCYDHFNELYPTMGIVQYCYAAIEGEETVYHIGVGFIGKRMPDSYKQNPCENYRINGMDRNGMWTVAPTSAAYQQRKEPRYWLSLPVSVSFRKKGEKQRLRDEAVTLNIAGGGASIATSIAASVGDKIKFAYKEANFYSVAEVKGRRFRNGEPACLHVEFLDNRFPIGVVVNAATQPRPESQIETEELVDTDAG